MADGFPDTPLAGPEATLGWSQRTPSFFPDSPPPSNGTIGGGGGGGGSSHGSSAAPSRKYSAASAPPDVDSSTEGRRRRKDYDRDAAIEVRSGRLDTLGWVSGSWEPRCVTLHADGSLSVRPLGNKGRKAASAQQQQQQQQQQQEQQQRQKQQREQQRHPSTLSVSNFASNASNNSTSSTSQPMWSPLVKRLSGRTGGAGGLDRTSLGRPPSGSSNGGPFAGMGSGSGGHHHGTLRLGQRLVMGTSYGQRPRVVAMDRSLSDHEIQASSDDGGADVDDSQSIATSMGSHFDSTGGDSQTRHSVLRPNSMFGGLKRLGSGRKPRTADGNGSVPTARRSGSVGFDEGDENKNEPDENSGREEDNADDVDLAKWDLSRPGKRDKDGRLVIQLRYPSSSTYLLLGTTDSLLSEEWLEDLLYVKQRTLALEWTRRFKLKIATNPSPPLRAFASLPDRDWNREWEAAFSLTGGGRGGRDPRVTIALRQQFRAFAGAIAAAMVRSNDARPRTQLEWEALTPVRSVNDDEDDKGRRSTGGIFPVGKVLSSTTPGECWVFSVGSVAFVVAPRGTGSGYRTHKRLGAELKGEHILRRAVEKRILSGSSGGGSSGRSRVNALAPLSCVVDVHGCRAAAIALPGVRGHGKKHKHAARPKRLGHLGAAVPWVFSEVRSVGPGGRTKTIRYNDVRSLIKDHLRLEDGDEPDLSIVEGVLSGGGKSKESRAKDASNEDGLGKGKSPPAAVVLFPDLLPPEVIPPPSAPALATGGAAAAVWGSVEAVRAVLVPEDSALPVRTVLSLDLSVAEASMAAAAALAADNEGLDSFQIAPENSEHPATTGRSSSNSFHIPANGAGNVPGNRNSRKSSTADENIDDDNRFFAAGGLSLGFGYAYKSGYNHSVRAAAEEERNRRATLLAEAIANALNCDREAVLTTRLTCRGMDLSSVRRDASSSSNAYGSKAGTPSSANSLGASAWSATVGIGGGVYESDTQLKSYDVSASAQPALVNGRASAFAERKVMGDVVVLLEGGGVRHGAAGVEIRDADDAYGTAIGGTANAEKARNPLRLREELLKQLRLPRGSQNGRPPATASVDGSRLMTDTLLPRMAARVANDAVCSGGSAMSSQMDERISPLFLFEGGHLCAAMHGAGLNLRYLPALRRCLGWEHTGTRQLIAAEILARTAKHVLACRLRQACASDEEEGRMGRGSRGEGDGEDEEVSSMTSSSLLSTSMEDISRERFRTATLTLLNAVLFRTSFVGDTSRDFARWGTALDGTTPSPTINPINPPVALEGKSRRKKEQQFHGVSKPWGEQASAVTGDLEDNGDWEQQQQPLEDDSASRGTNGSSSNTNNGVPKSSIAMLKAGRELLTRVKEKSSSRPTATPIGWLGVATGNVWADTAMNTAPGAGGGGSHANYSDGKDKKIELGLRLGLSPSRSTDDNARAHTTTGQIAADSSPLPPPLSPLKPGARARGATPTDMDRPNQGFDSRLPSIGSSASYVRGDSGGGRVESRLWLLLGPFGSVGGMSLEEPECEEEAHSKLHMCRGLSGVHLLPALTRNLGVLLTPTALRRIQEEGYFGSLNPSDIDSRTGAPAALAGSRFKGLGEEANAVKRRLREKCRRRWVADGKLSRSGGGGGGGGFGDTSGSGSGSGSGGGGGIGWTGVSAEERAQYAVVAESILGPFIDSEGRDDVAFARREIAESRLALAVTDWYEGNVLSAKREVERAMRALLEGKLGIKGDKSKEGSLTAGVVKTESFALGEMLGNLDEEGEEGEGVRGVPVPLVLCIAGALMHLIATRDKKLNGSRSADLDSNGLKSNGFASGRLGEWASGNPIQSDSELEKGFVWLWRVLQVHFPGTSSTIRVPSPTATNNSSSNNTSVWGSHPLVPAIACLLSGKTLGEATTEEVALRKRGSGGGGRVADWLAGLLETTRLPGHHLGVLVGRRTLSPADVAARMVYKLLNGERGFVEKSFKGTAYVPGSVELMTTPESFKWLLGPSDESDGSRRGPFTPEEFTAESAAAEGVLPLEESRVMIRSLKHEAQSVGGRVYIDGNVCGLSAEEEQQQAVLRPGDAEAPAIRMSRLRLPMEGCVLQVSCGHRHSALVTASGLVLTVGCGETGRLGHGDETDVLQPKVVRGLAEAGQTVVSAGCGREHTLVALTSGGVFAWGWGEGGRLGLGEVGAVLSPTRVEEFDNLGVSVCKVACGREHSLAVSDAGRLYTFGPYEGGRLGLVAVPGQRGVSAPRIVRSGLSQERVVDAAGGDLHSACVCESGKVFTWGHGNTGALGHGITEDEAMPRLVAFFGPEAAAASTPTRSRVSTQPEAPGEMVTNQSNGASPSSKAAHQGNGTTSDRGPGSLLATSVACGAWHTLVLTSAGTVFAFGDGFTGQLGLTDRGHLEAAQTLAPREVQIETSRAGGDEAFPSSSPIPTVRIAQVACGSFSSSAVSTEGVLYCWGKADASSDISPVEHISYLLPRRVSTTYGRPYPVYRTVAQGGYITMGIADEVKTDSLQRDVVDRGSGRNSAGRHRSFF